MGRGNFTVKSMVQRPRLRPANTPNAAKILQTFCDLDNNLLKVREGQLRHMHRLLTFVEDRLVQMLGF